MRHATAVDPTPRERDVARALTPNGRKDARAMGAWLLGLSLPVAKVLCSPALRTQQTAELALGAWAAAPKIESPAALYLAECVTLVTLIEQAGPGVVWLIGHNPGLEELLAYLLPAQVMARIAAATVLPPAGIYVVDLRLEGGLVIAGSGQLRVAMRPKQLAPRE